ncbi:tripartite tricarboxylate transporter TctB family protein [Rhizobium sp. AQ_MP]|uniref:tripartite tricarboxylate transporter TctB family protein n=1 Tax=Rhizobium sp. AQ_MP TaxID=2761536 RepID=UPI00163A4EEE|nr:tripartite tricarboxylate transporter TctB family protein [Rhizobium sp. AQ_MP]MBC2775071.1 tripartite tricarboxylate transporter TctB family protein [Rhizobium sp. AQ_MP]
MSSEERSSTDRSRRPDWAALIIALVLVVMAGVILYDVARLQGGNVYSGIGPATVPKGIAIGLIGLGVWTVFAAMRRDFPEREHQELPPILFIVAGLAAQMMLLKTAGFSIATGILFALTAAGFGKRKFWISLPAGIALSFVVWIVFARFLQLSLPAGPLERLFF